MFCGYSVFIICDLIELLFTEWSLIMISQEEKEYQEFIEKFLRSVFELKSDFEKLSENSKVRVREYIVNSAETQAQFEILKLIANRL